MKRNRKGFSLVELIVVLVIMAIIAALCAPNISAYVQAAKVQNYQTVANNLADELQTQLPQSRYWNWDEVQRNAYGILCADAGRCVTLDTEKSTDNQKVYQITGASSDANAVFTVSLTYHDAVKTSQKVDIAVSCDGYAAVQSVQECNLVLKTNYTDASLYQEISMPNPNRDESGWKPMKNMGGLYGYWKTFNAANREHNFGQPFDTNDNSFYLNLTDYPAGTVEQVMFTMQRYQVTQNRKELGYFDDDTKKWTLAPNKELNEGDSYTTNHYHYLDDDKPAGQYAYVYSQIGYYDENNNWHIVNNYKAGDVYTASVGKDTGFDRTGNTRTVIGYYDVNHNWKKADNYQVGDTVDVYYAKNVYGEEVEYTGDVYQNSNGEYYANIETWYWSWMILTGGNPDKSLVLKSYICEDRVVYSWWENGEEKMEDIIQKDYVCKERFFAIENNVTREVKSVSHTYTISAKYYDDYTVVYPIMQWEKAAGTGEQDSLRTVEDCSLIEIYVGNNVWVKYTDVFNVDDNHTFKNTDAAKAYKEYYTTDQTIQDGPKSGGASFTWERGLVSNTDIKYRMSLPDSTRGWLYLNGAVIGNKILHIQPKIDDNLQVYVNYHRDLSTYDINPKLMATESGDVNNNNYKKLWIDISNCGYCVGNVLKITLRNVDIDNIVKNLSKVQIKMSTPNKQHEEGASNFAYTAYGQDWINKHTDLSGNITPTYDFPIEGLGVTLPSSDVYSITVPEGKKDTLEIRIKATWMMYPYLWIYFPYAKDNFSFDSHIDMEWESGGSSSGNPITTSIPMLTLNGDSTYTNITLDWTKCDYITNAGEVGVKFVKYPSTLNYDVYSKDYTLLAPDQNLKTFMMNSNSAVTSAASADKIVNLYCKGVSPEEIQCEIVAPKNTATTTTTTTTTPLPPETETTAKTTTSKTTAATTTTTATTATTTTTTTATTTTTTTTTAATTSTAATTATTATAATTTAETTASSTATATTSATETTAATTTTSTTTSTTISTTATTVTTSTSATETSGGVVTSVIENASYDREITIPNYKNIIAIDVDFENANNGGGQYIISNNDSDAERKDYHINKNQLNLHIDVPGSDNGIVMYSKFKLTHWGDGNIKSITFVYRDTVPLEWLVDDGYTVQSKNEMATLNSNYEFTITWNKDTKNIPAVVANCDVISPKSSTESTATYSVPISQKTRISVVNGSAVTLDNVAFGEGIDLTQYNFESIYAVEIQVGDFTSTRGSFGGAIYEGGWENRKSISLSPSDWNDSLKVDYTVARNRLTIDGWNASLKKVVLYFNRPSAATAEQIVIHKMMRNDPVSMFLVNSSEHQTVTSTTTLQTTAPQTTTTTTTTTTAPPIAASENGKNVGLDESSAAGCNITFSDPLFNDSGVCYFTITPKAGYTLSDSYTVKVGTEVLSAKNNYNAKTGQWFFWSNKIMTDYTIHVEGVSPAA